MPHLHLETSIAATPQQCFDLSLAVDAHIRSMGASRERVVAGRTHGLLELGDSVTRHEWLKQALEDGLADI